jgi:hypothetical protein
MDCSMSQAAVERVTRVVTEPARTTALVAGAFRLPPATAITSG